MAYTANYSEYNQFSRLSNLDSLTAKMILHLVNSKSKYAENIWKILGYNNPNTLLSPNLTNKEKINLVDTGGNGEETSKRIFQKPFINDAWTQESSSVYFYIDSGYPMNQGNCIVNVGVDCIVHSKLANIYGDGDLEENPFANPNDTTDNGELIVQRKNRAEVLLKNIIAEFNGLYLDGIGYLQFNQVLGGRSNFKQQLWNNRAFYGYTIIFAVAMSGNSENPTIR